MLLNTTAFAATRGDPDEAPLAGDAPVLQAIVWLADMADFAAMNEVWETWVSPGNTPARATGEAKLAAPEYKVEFIITAALPD